MCYRLARSREIPGEVSDLVLPVRVAEGNRATDEDRTIERCRVRKDPGRIRTYAGSTATRRARRSSQPCTRR